MRIHSHAANTFCAVDESSCYTFWCEHTEVVDFLFSALTCRIDHWDWAEIWAAQIKSYFIVQGWQQKRSQIHSPTVPNSPQPQTWPSENLSGIEMLLIEICLVWISALIKTELNICCFQDLFHPHPTPNLMPLHLQFFQYIYLTIPLFQWREPFNTIKQSLQSNVSMFTGPWKKYPLFKLLLSYINKTIKNMCSLYPTLDNDINGIKCTVVLQLSVLHLDLKADKASSAPLTSAGNSWSEHTLTL